MATKIRGAIVESEAETDVRDVIVKIVLDAYEEIGLSDISALPRRIMGEIIAKYGEGWTCSIVQGTAAVATHYVKRTMINIQTGCVRFIVSYATGIIGGAFGAYGGKDAQIVASTATQSEMDAALTMIKTLDSTIPLEPISRAIANTMRDTFKCEWFVMIGSGQFNAYATDKDHRCIHISAGLCQILLVTM